MAHQTTRGEPGTQVCPPPCLQGEILTRGEAREAKSAAGIGGKHREGQMLRVSVAVNKFIPPAPPR